MCERRTGICRVLQLLSTLYTKFLEDCRAFQLSDQEGRYICMVNQLQLGLLRVEAAYMQGFNSEAFWFKQAVFCQDRLL